MRGLTTLETRLLWELDHPGSRPGCDQPGASYTADELQAFQDLAKRGIVVLTHCWSGQNHTHWVISKLGREVIALQKLVTG